MRLQTLNLTLTLTPKTNPNSTPKSEDLNMAVLGF